MKIVFGALLALYLAFSVTHVRAQGPVDNVATLQHDWAEAYYNVPAADKVAHFKSLIARADQLVQASPGRSEPLVWSAIILSSAAKFDGGLGALGMIKDARKRLLAAEKIDPDALDGSVYTSLGSLYAKAPGWPLSFGDKDKASEYLQKALQINPEGIDPNFFYGELLLERGDRVGARSYLTRALNAPARPGREDADLGRRQEIKEVLARL